MTLIIAQDTPFVLHYLASSDAFRDHCRRSGDLLSSIMNQTTTDGTIDPAWKGLCTAGGVASLVAALVFRRNIGAEVMLLRLLGVLQTGPTVEPVSAAGWFDLFQSDPLVALTLFGLFDLVNYFLVALIYLGLYAALRQVNRSAMVIAAAFGLVGMGVYFASNQAFAMQFASNRYAAASSDLERTMVLAAGEALLAIHNAGAVFQGAGAVSYTHLTLPTSDLV